MIRALLWYFGAGWANLVRLIIPGSRTVYYFAFGANLDDSVLKQRKIKVFERFDHCLDGAELAFTQPGFYCQHGYASADPCPGKQVYGRVYKILASDARRMDYFEGEAALRVHVKDYGDANGRRFYYYRTTRIVSGLKPTQQYLNYLLDAYREMEIVPQDYIDQMAKTEVLTELKPMTNTSVFISDLTTWPRPLRPLLLGYERLLQSFIEYFWHRSIIDWMIKYR